MGILAAACCSTHQHLAVVCTCPDAEMPMFQRITERDPKICVHIIVSDVDDVS